VFFASSTCTLSTLRRFILSQTRPSFCRNVKRFRGGLVLKAHRLVYHSTLGSRVIKKKRRSPTRRRYRARAHSGQFSERVTLHHVRSLENRNTLQWRVGGAIFTTSVENLLVVPFSPQKLRRGLASTWWCPADIEQLWRVRVRVRVATRAKYNAWAIYRVGVLRMLLKSGERAMA